jgi:hypothetical protein
MCEECHPPGYTPSEGDVDDHVILRRGELVRVHLTNGTAGNADVEHVGRHGVRLNIRSITLDGEDVEWPGDLAEFVVVVPWSHIVSMQIDPTDPWPNERKFLRKLAKKYPQHFADDGEVGS